jgi:hypothetical protein
VEEEVVLWLCLIRAPGPQKQPQRFRHSTPPAAQPTREELLDIEDELQTPREPGNPKEKVDARTWGLSAACEGILVVEKKIVAACLTPAARGKYVA